LILCLLVGFHVDCAVTFPDQPSSAPSPSALIHHALDSSESQVEGQGASDPDAVSRAAPFARLYPDVASPGVSTMPARPPLSSGSWARMSTPSVPRWASSSRPSTTRGKMENLHVSLATTNPGDRYRLNICWSKSFPHRRSCPLKRRRGRRRPKDVEVVLEKLL